MNDTTIDDYRKRGEGGGGDLQFVTLFETNGDDDRSYSTSNNSGKMMMTMIMYIYSRQVHGCVTYSACICFPL